MALFTAVLAALMLGDVASAREPESRPLTQVACESEDTHPAHVTPRTEPQPVELAPAAAPPPLVEGSAQPSSRPVETRAKRGVEAPAPMVVPAPVRKPASFDLNNPYAGER